MSVIEHLRRLIEPVTSTKAEKAYKRASESLEQSLLEQPSINCYCILTSQNSQGYITLRRDHWNHNVLLALGAEQGSAHNTGGLNVAVNTT